MLNTKWQKLMTKQQINPEEFIGCMYQLQYVDYDENHWTLPVRLNRKRLKRIFEDLSITKVKLLKDGTEYILEVK